ncbi:MAG: NlpC/P60 family protein, partial [Eubacteriales bacterium]|nr:NlpC/P60 family protein [Eubacteriales bacterium]
RMAPVVSPCPASPTPSEEPTPSPTPTAEPKDEKPAADTGDVTEWPLSGLSELNASATENTRMHEVFSRPIVVSDFRFWSIGKTYAFAREDMAVYEEMNVNSRQVGSLKELGLAFVLQDEDKKGNDASDDWLYVESGRVRGYIPKASVYTGREADDIFKKYCEAAGKKVNTAKELEKLKETADFSVLYAEQTVPVSENKAFTHTRSTTETVVVEKIYAISVTEVTNIRESMDDGAEITGTMKPGTLCFIIKECEDGWLFIESGNVRGFVHRSDVNMNDDVQDSFRDGKRDEKDMPTAKAEISTKDNSSLYYVLQSVRSGVPTGKIRESILEYASSFLGHPYVWGGTDPENGADCSGFVQSIYAQYGYTLPRVAEAQAYAGEQIPVEEAEPGDLIFYRDSTGYIYHVVMYAGDGRTVEAHSSEMGIIHGYVSQSACWAVRVINDAREFEVPEEYDGHPIGTNNCYTYTPHYGTWDWQYACRFVFEKWKRAGAQYYQNVAVMDNKYLIACTNLYGVVGDHITWYFDDGSSIETIMADTKSTGDPNYTPWGHIHSGIINVLEFEVDLGIHPGTTECVPEVGGKRVVSWVNHGSAF